MNFRRAAGGVLVGLLFVLAAVLHHDDAVADSHDGTLLCQTAGGEDVAVRRDPNWMVLIPIRGDVCHIARDGGDISCFSNPGFLFCGNPPEHNCVDRDNDGEAFRGTVNNWWIEPIPTSGRPDFAIPLVTCDELRAQCEADEVYARGTVITPNTGGNETFGQPNRLLGCVPAASPETVAATVVAEELPATGGHIVTVSWSPAPGAGNGEEATYEIQRAVNGTLFVLLTMVNTVSRWTQSESVTLVEGATLFYYDADDALDGGATVRYRVRLAGTAAGEAAEFSAATGPAVLPDLDCKGANRPEAGRGTCGAECGFGELPIGRECRSNLPGTPSATVNGDHSVSVTWGPAPLPGDPPGYEVERDVNGEGFAALATVGGLFYHDEEVSAGWTLSYRIRATTALAETDPELFWAETGAVTILQFDCEALLREDGPRGSCKECRADVAWAATVIAGTGAAAAAGSEVCVKRPTTPDDPDDAEFGALLDDDTLCGVFGGTLQDAGDGRQACSAVDAADTFCLTAADAATGFAFACRGLFRHVRQCNFEFNRPALNPFLCGPKCDEGDNNWETARGGKCCLGSELAAKWDCVEEDEAE